jgi:phosphate transport system protein
VQETRHHFHEDLKELERQALGGLEVVIDALECALESIMRQDVGLVGTVLANADRIDRNCLKVHQELLAQLARQAPVAGDLRTVVALLHVVRSVERMAAQCANIAKLVPLSGHDQPKDNEILAAIEQMGQLTRSSVLHAKTHSPRAAPSSLKTSCPRTRPSTSSTARYSGARS